MVKGRRYAANCTSLVRKKEDKHSLTGGEREREREGKLGGGGRGGGEFSVTRGLFSPIGKTELEQTKLFLENKNT